MYEGEKSDKKSVLQKKARLCCQDDRFPSPSKEKRKPTDGKVIREKKAERSGERINGKLEELSLPSVEEQLKLGNKSKDGENQKAFQKSSEISGQRYVVSGNKRAAGASKKNKTASVARVQRYVAQHDEAFRGSQSARNVCAKKRKKETAKCGSCDSPPFLTKRGRARLDKKNGVCERERERPVSPIDLKEKSPATFLCVLLRSCGHPKKKR